MKEPWNGPRNEPTNGRRRRMTIGTLAARIGLPAWVGACAVVLLLTACSDKKETNGKVSMKRDRSARGEIPQGMNRLALEKSPYLLQHADNPVDWYPWGGEAFEKAGRENKPIFLSIGYSTCHWCHVMEHESFEDSTVAALMNDAFVCIKVDREERPDVDAVYMTVCQLMTGGGGWPLTIIMTPDRKPFYAATYIPREDRFGRPGMLGLVPKIKEYWLTRREDVEKASGQLTEQLISYAGDDKSSDEVLGVEGLELGRNQLEQRFDHSYGGFGSAPKFPTPHNLIFLLRYWHRTGDGTALEMATKTLDEMSRGGMYDHVGFGFHRYSTDAKWFAPHFEKMLYDQALLVLAYTEGYLATKKPDYRRVAEEILAYVFRDLADAGGAFYSAEDADSEGIEGKFYLWTAGEIRRLLGDEDAELLIDVFGVDDRGNFGQEVEGGNILYLRVPVAAMAREKRTSELELRARLERIRAKLFAEREKRVRPFKDDKILTDWNGLMIAAAARAGGAFGKPEYIERAKKAADFIRTKLRDEKGRLLHLYRLGQASIPANLDDHAFLIWGLLDLYEASLDVEYLEWALELEKTMSERFWDRGKGGYFFTPDDGEALLVRLKEVYDGALPSGNSAAMLGLLRLGRMTGNPDLEDRAEKIGKAFHRDVSRAPSAFTLMLCAVDFAIGPSFEVVIVGDRDAPDTRALMDALHGLYLPRKVVLFKPAGEGSPRISRIARFTESQAPVGGRATAYVCRNYACDLPTTEAGAMVDLLTAKPR